MVCFNDKKLYEKAKVLRAWGRSSAIYNENESIKKRFKKDKLNFNYDKKYVFLEFGYNFIPSEFSAAFAIEQIKNLKKNFQIRNKNFKFISQFLSKYNDLIEIPIQESHIKTCWLAYPFIIKPNKLFDRNELQIFLERKKIQTRVIFSGNILKQPLMKKKNFIRTKNCDLESNYIMKNGILIGCHHGMTKKDLQYVSDTINKFIKNKKKLN